MRSFHRGEFPNFAGNFTWGISQLYGMDRKIFNMVKPSAIASTKAIFRRYERYLVSLLEFVLLQLYDS